MNTITYLKSNIPLIGINSDIIIDKTCVLSWLCPFCNNTYNPIISSDPFGKYGSFYIQCDGCLDRDTPSFIGIKIIRESAFKGFNLGILDGFYIYAIQIFKFTHYYGTTEFVKYDIPRYTFKLDECYNRTFLVTDGEFRFGFD